MAQFLGTWVGEGGRLTCRVLPGCACATIGQIICCGHNGAYFDGDTHGAGAGAQIRHAPEEAREKLSQNPADRPFR